MIAWPSPGGLVFLFHVVEGLVQSKEHFGCGFKQRLSLRVRDFAGVLARAGGDDMERLLESGDMMTRI